MVGTEEAPPRLLRGVLRPFPLMLRPLRFTAPGEIEVDALPEPGVKPRMHSKICGYAVSCFAGGAPEFVRIAFMSFRRVPPTLPSPGRRLELQKWSLSELNERFLVFRMACGVTARRWRIKSLSDKRAMLPPSRIACFSRTKKFARCC